MRKDQSQLITTVDVKVKPSEINLFTGSSVLISKEPIGLLNPVSACQYIFSETK